MGEMKYLLAKQGVFLTIQGEGAMAGDPMTFIRLGGCSVGCKECDTNYKTVEKVSTVEIIQRVENLSIVARRWVWITGGEPMDQDLSDLTQALHDLGHSIAIATSGVKEIPHGWANWISVSPHSVNIQQTYGNEIKIIPGLNGLTFEDISKLRPSMFAYKYIQPLWEGQTQECIDFVLKNPGWRLGIQAHKYWCIP